MGITSVFESKEKKDFYLHREISYSQAHQDTCAKLKEKYEEKHEEVEGTVTPEDKRNEYVNTTCA